MAERNIKFWANWARAIDWLPDDVKESFAWKVVEYALLDREPTFEGCEMPVWEMIKTSVDSDLKASENGGKGGRPRGAKTPRKTPLKTPGKTTSETTYKTSPKTLINESEAEAESESEAEAEFNAPLLPPSSECDNEAAEFAVKALAVFNDETGSDVRDLSPAAWQGLRRIRDSGRTLDDVRSVVRRKHAQWGGSGKMAQFIRPSTLFGPKFDEYLNEVEGGAVDAEFEDLACGF